MLTESEYFFPLTMLNSLPVSRDMQIQLTTAMTKEPSYITRYAKESTDTHTHTQRQQSHKRRARVLQRRSYGLISCFSSFFIFYWKNNASPSSGTGSAISSSVPVPFPATQTRAAFVGRAGASSAWSWGPFARDARVTVMRQTLNMHEGKIVIRIWLIIGLGSAVPREIGVSIGVSVICIKIPLCGMDRAVDAENKQL